MGSAADGMHALSAITVGTIPAISRFIDSSSDMNVLLTITLNYTHDFLANVRGGIGPGAVGTGIFQPQLDLDLEKARGMGGRQIPHPWPHHPRAFVQSDLSLNTGADWGYADARLEVPTHSQTSKPRPINVGVVIV
jgi:hypothetical protein